MQAITGVVSRLSPSIFRPVGTYKHQKVGTRVHLGILSNVSIWHPRTHDTEWKLRLRNPDDGEHVRMRIELALFDDTTVCLE